MTEPQLTIPEDHEDSHHLRMQGLVIGKLVAECHGRSKRAGWYNDPKTGEPIPRNVGEMLCLIHSEVSEALEGYRKNLNDTHLTDRPMIEVELADVLIRVFDLAGYLGLDLGESYRRKLLYNATRADHKPEVRAAGGKAF
jgi:NTP pyrophosphatase (non-canonical NTP hydrolase)